MRAAAVLALALALGGCSTISNAFKVAQGVTITQNEVDGARSGYDALFLVPLATYRNLGFCAAGAKATVAKPCADRGIVNKLAASDAIVKVEFDTVQHMIDTGDNTGMSAAYEALLSSIQAAEQIAAANGVK